MSVSMGKQPVESRMNTQNSEASSPSQAPAKTSQSSQGPRILGVPLGEMLLEKSIEMSHCVNLTLGVNRKYIWGLLRVGTRMTEMNFSDNRVLGIRISGV